MAAWVPGLVCNFYHGVVNNSTTTEPRGTISTDLEFLEFFDICLTKFKNNQILLNNISHRYLMTTRLFKAYLHARFQSAILK